MSIDVNCTAWRGFKTGEWRHVVNVRNFIQKNYTPYAGGDGFLEGTTEKTKKVWEKAHGLILEEVKGHCGRGYHSGVRHRQLCSRLY